MSERRSPSLIVSVVRAYRQEHRWRGLDELRSFADETTLRSAIARAGAAKRSDGKRYGHQRRLPARVLSQMQDRLLRSNFKVCSSFHQLYERVDEAIGSIHGVGDLAVYDTALRIGAKLGLSPDRVYLHRGTRQGARALGLNWRAPYLERKDLPAPLRKVPPREVEDILCIFKSFFDRTVRSLAGCVGRGGKSKRRRDSC